MSVEKMILQGDELEVQFHDRIPEKLVLTGTDLIELGKKVVDYLSNLEVEKQDKLEFIASEAERIIGELYKDFYRQGMYDKLLERVDGITEVVASLDNLTSMGTEKPEILERLWKQIRDLRKLMENKLPPPLTAENPDSTVPGESPEGCRAAMRILSESLYAMREKNGVIEQRIFLFRDFPSLLPPVRAFIAELVSLDEPHVRVALKQGEPRCTLCGACCRSYSVEVSPLDVERLADHFHMDCSEVCAAYLVPGRFSWNYGSHILKWADNGASTKDCVFIRKKSGSLYYCSIYDARPQVCREYTARNRLCEKTNLSMKSGLYPSSIISIDIFDSSLYLVTFYTHQEKQPPVVLQLSNHEKLREAHLAISKALDAERAILLQ